MKKSKHDKALSYTHRLLSIRLRSEKELKNRLFEKKFDPDTIKSIIEELKNRNLIDDLKFARLWIQSRMDSNPKGNMLLKKELCGKGISSTIIEKALSEREETEIGVANTIAEKKLKSLKGLPEEKVRKRLFDYLARRGFSFSVIGEILGEVKRN